MAEINEKKQAKSQWMSTIPLIQTTAIGVLAASLFEEEKKHGDAF